jgi:hypothetical protein
LGAMNKGFTDIFAVSKLDIFAMFQGRF